MANIYKEFLWGLTMYSKKEKKEMFVDLNRVLNTKQTKSKWPRLKSTIAILSRTFKIMNLKVLYQLYLC